MGINVALAMTLVKGYVEIADTQRLQKEPRVKRSTIQARRAANKLKDSEIELWLQRGGRNCYEELMRQAFREGNADIADWLQKAGYDFVWGDR